MTDDCYTEIRSLHDFFQDWYLGNLAETDAVFDRFAQAMDSTFTMITPEGKQVERADVLDGVRAAFGSRANTGFAIRVQPVSVLELGGGYFLAVYEEWQTRPEGETAWTSSALLVHDAEAHDGFRWLHVHETYLPGMGPA